MGFLWVTVGASVAYTALCMATGIQGPFSVYCERYPNPNSARTAVKPCLYSCARTGYSRKAVPVNRTRRWSDKGSPQSDVRGPRNALSQKWPRMVFRTNKQTFKPGPRPATPTTFFHAAPPVLHARPRGGVSHELTVR